MTHRIWSPARPSHIIRGTRHCGRAVDRRKDQAARPKPGRRRDFVVRSGNEKEQTMGMFDTTGKSGHEGRSPATLAKLERMNKALRHEEPDRVPISDFFWGSFIEPLAQAISVCRTTPTRTTTTISTGSSPCRTWTRWIRPFETLRESRGRGRRQDRLRGGDAKEVRLPHARVRSPGRPTRSRSSKRFEFDVRRTTGGGSSKRATTRSPASATASSETRPPWIETVKSLRPDFPVYGSMIDGTNVSPG